jgi:hypothetical protein
MDLYDLISQLIQHTAPGKLAMVAGAVGTVKVVVDLIKRSPLGARLTQNVTKLVAGAVSACVILLPAALSRNLPVSQDDWLTTLLLIPLVWAGAMGLHQGSPHQIAQDRGKLLSESLPRPAAAPGEPQ